MGALRLELRCPKHVHEIAVDPEPNWSFESLLSELNSLEKKLDMSSATLSTIHNFLPLDGSGNGVTGGRSRAFVMQISEDDNLDSEDEDIIGDSFINSSFHFLNKDELLEGALEDQIHQNQLEVQEDIRNQVITLEAELMSKNEKYSSAFIQIEKYKETREEVERETDIYCQQKIADELNRHIAYVQRDHELKSEFEENKIKNDAAQEETKRKERALLEEKIRCERARVVAEEEHKAQEISKAALEPAKATTVYDFEAQRTGIITVSDTGGIVKKESKTHIAAPGYANISTVVPAKDASVSRTDVRSENKNVHASGGNSAKKLEPQLLDSCVRISENALALERSRLQKRKELDDANQLLFQRSDEILGAYEKQIAKLIRQIRGLRRNVYSKASELVKILKDPSCPQSFSVATFARKVVSHCESPDNAAFACAHVVVLVASQAPQLMDIVLAEFHNACIYTVPKHIVFSKAVFESREAYQKAIGFREICGKMESIDEYLDRLKSYMALYAALIQTEISGMHNPHGLKEGWAWLARFLNVLPADIFTSTALITFLQAAGFALFKKYRSQFMKILNIIHNDFLKALQERDDTALNPIIFDIQSYVEDKRYLIEPDGRTLQDSSLSSIMVP